MKKVWLVEKEGEFKSSTLAICTNEEKAIEFKDKLKKEMKPIYDEFEFIVTVVKTNRLSC